LPPSPEGFLAFATPRLAPASIGLRPALEADAALVAAIYASTREEELRRTDWDAAQKKAFTDWQSQQQEQHYFTHYARAERLLVMHPQPIGRIYVDTTATDVRLMDVTLLPEHRNRGVGSRLMEAFVAYADGLGRKSSLHVEPFNPAMRLYLRLGYRAVENRGLYEYMVRDVGPLS
jgi:GNAT superfamily N-acetyltransferase